MNTVPLAPYLPAEKNIPYARAARTALSPYSNKSVLRYPGGKTRAVEIITAYFPEGITELCSPFFGGGSIELFLAASGVKVYGYDIFTPLIEFWQCVQKDPGRLADEVEKYYPLSKRKFYELQQQQTRFRTKLERAAIYYVLNRSSFSGATLSGGMSPEHPRFTRSAIDRLREFHNPNFSIQKRHFRDAVQAHPGMFLYLDPPYLIESSLYGKKGNAHRGFDHVLLSEILNGRDYWIMSYNDCPAIRELYRDCVILTPAWKYGMSNDKTSKEVLIFSKELKPCC